MLFINHIIITIITHIYNLFISDSQTFTARCLDIVVVCRNVSSSNVDTHPQTTTTSRLKHRKTFYKSLILMILTIERIFLYIMALHTTRK
jgi:hypothetical protein